MLVSQHFVPTALDAIEAVLNEWRACWPQLGVVILLPEAEKESLPLLQGAFRELNIPMAGAIFPALLNDSDFLTSGAWLLCFDQMPPCFLITEAEAPLSLQLAEATQAALAEKGPGNPPPTLFMIFDGMIQTVATILNNLRQILQASVCYAGVNAGSETFQAMPCLFDNDRTVGNGVLALLLPAETQVVVRHGYPVSKTLMRATSGHGNRIDTINNRSAFAMYQEVIKAEYGVTLTHENFYDFAVHFPFGVVTSLDVLVRIPVSFNDDGSLYCVGEVPANTLLRLLKAPDLESSHCIASIAQCLNSPQGSMYERPLLTFYCAGRRMHFGSESAREIVQLKALTGASAIFGALSLGEIDQIADLGFPRFHNATLVCIAQP